MVCDFINIGCWFVWEWIKSWEFNNGFGIFLRIYWLVSIVGWVGWSCRLVSELFWGWKFIVILGWREDRFWFEVWVIVWFVLV